MHFRTAALPLVLLVLGCGPKPDPGDTDGTTAGESTAGSAETGATTEAGATTETGAAPTTGGATTNSASEGLSSSGDVVVTTGGTTADPTGLTTEDPTGLTTEDPGGGGPLEEACTAACKTIGACRAPERGCVEDCLMSFGEDAECEKVASEFMTCVSTMTCEQIELLFEEDEPTVCAEQFAALNMCSGIECAMFGGGGMPGQCLLGRDCGGVVESYECDGDTCACKEDDVTVKECPAMDFCALDLEMQTAEVVACCGWDWT